MEPKKNPKYDVHKKRTIIFNFSLMLSLLLVISAFRIAVPLEDTIVLRPSDDVDTYVPDIPITDSKQKEPDVKPRKEKSIILTQPNFVPVKESAADPLPGIDNNVDPPTDETFGNIVAPPEVIDDTTTWIHVEKSPEHLGGLKEFYRIINKNIVYPPKARRTDTEGTVYVQFTVDKTGELTNIKILKGIGQGCDEEAMRVIALTKWSPGKQRGKPVKVKMVLPIVFDLQ